MERAGAEESQAPAPCVHRMGKTAIGLTTPENAKHDLVGHIVISCAALNGLFAYAMSKVTRTPVVLPEVVCLMKTKSVMVARF